MAHFSRITQRRVSGFSMIEVLVTLIVLMFGLLGAVGLMSASQKAELESYQRIQAIILLDDMVGRINANRKVASCYAVTTLTSGSPFLGTGSTAGTPTCAVAGVSADQNARAISDLTDWGNTLLGNSEVLGGNNNGAMIGARGCISYDATNDIFIVSVTWQGLNKTIASSPSIKCASDEYGTAAQRRIVSATVKIATLGT